MDIRMATSRRNCGAARQTCVAHQGKHQAVCSHSTETMTQLRFVTEVGQIVQLLGSVTELPTHLTQWEHYSCCQVQANNCDCESQMSCSHV